MISTKIVKIDPTAPSQTEIETAARALRKGALVIIPTETVYGIAANMLDRRAMRRLYKIKDRPMDKPFSVLIADKNKIEDFAFDIPTAAYKLIAAFWPGPLTLVLKSKTKDATIGLRMPNNDIALRLIHLAGVPLVCPSANLSGRPAPGGFQSAIKDFNGKVEFAIDAGESKIGVESSIVDLANGSLNILREGAIRKEKIEQAVNKKIVLFVCTGNSCRSVMAKALLEKQAKEARRNDIEVLSAGIAIVGGYRATQETVDLMHREGIDVSGHYTQRISPDMIKKSDIILVMEKLHESRIVELVPEAKNRVFLLKEFAKIEDNNLDIEDPIGKPPGAYAGTLNIIKEAITRVARII